MGDQHYFSNVRTMLLNLCHNKHNDAWTEFSDLKEVKDEMDL